MAKLKKYILNNQPVWQGEIIRYKGRKTLFPVKFTIRQLNRNDADAMSVLSSTIYQNLKEGEECFIHKHDQKYYQQIFNNKDVRYIGIFVGSRLVGMSYLRICQNEQAVAEELPNSPVNFFNRKDYTQVASFGADCVLPAFRGNALNQIMIACRLELAHHLNCTDAVSIVDRYNHWNMPPYFNNDFQMFATAIDPADGGKIALMHHSLSHSQAKQPKYGVKIPYNCFNTIDLLLQKGFVGNGFHKESSCVLLTRTSHAIHCAQQSVARFISPMQEERVYA